MAVPEPQVTLLSARDVRETLDLASPPIILEACVSNQEVSPLGYLPGTILLSLADIDVYEEDSRGHPKCVSGNYSLQPPASVRSAFENAGIVHSRHVIVLTQATRAGGVDLAVAGRLCWALCWAGVSHVSLFAGGVQGWAHEGFALVATPNSSRVTDFFNGLPLPFPLRPALCASTAEVEAAMGSHSDVQLADVRSWKEFLGEGHDYPFALPQGRIPGARWAHWGPSTYVGGDFFRHETGALHPLTQTATLWRDWGLELARAGDAQAQQRKIIFYCGSGWRSAVAWVLAQLLGHRHCASYDGGFLEWSLLDDRAAEHPIARGWNPREQHDTHPLGFGPAPITSTSEREVAV